MLKNSFQFSSSFHTMYKISVSFSCMQSFQMPGKGRIIFFCSIGNCWEMLRSDWLFENTMFKFQIKMLDSKRLNSQECSNQVVQALISFRHINPTKVFRFWKPCTLNPNLKVAISEALSCFKNWFFFFISYVCRIIFELLNGNAAGNFFQSL